MTLVIKQAGLEEYLSGSEKIKVLVLGPSGAGKSRLFSFAPKPIYADCDKSVLSIADRRVPYGRINSREDMDQFLQVLRREAMKPEPARQWETVVVDTIDRYARTVTQQYLRKTGKKEMENWDDWGYLEAAMTDLISTLMEMPFNVVILGHTKEKTINEQDVLGIDLKGSVKDAIFGDFDFVGHMTTEFVASTPADGEGRLVKRVINWSATPYTPWAKARGGGLVKTNVCEPGQDFTPAGWEVIKSGIVAQIESQHLVQGETLETVENSAEPQTAPTVGNVMAPQPGGPVSTGLRTAKKAAAAPTAQPTLPAPQQGAQRVPPALLAKTPPPPVKRPEPVPGTPAAAEQMQEAVNTVETALGGKVVSDTAPTEQEPPVEKQAEPAQDQPAEQPIEDPTTDVVEPTPEPTAEPTAEPTDNPFPTDGVWTTVCGGPRYAHSIPTPGVGCGQPITLTLEGGRVVGAEDGQVTNLIDIAAVKFQAVLHNPCFAKARN